MSKTSISREELIELVATYDSVRDGAMKNKHVDGTTASIIYGISILMWIMVHVFLQDNPKKK
jgi:hypothetical protein